MENLLTRSRTVFTPPRKKGGWFLMPHSLVWRTESQLLGLARRHRDAEQSFRRVAIDLPSGRITEIGQTRFWHGCESLSPDGRWIAGIDFATAEVRIHSAEGRRHWSWRGQTAQTQYRRLLASNLLWLRGGESWVVLLSDLERLWAVTGASNAPERARTIDLGKPNAATGGQGIWDGIDPGDLLYSPDDDLIHGVNAPGYTPLGNDNQLRRFSFRLSRGKPSRIESVVPFLAGVSIGRIAYSPAARRLAILSLQRLGGPMPTVSLHTMRPNGRERICLGSVEQVGTGDFLDPLQWLPSGKALSFWHNDELHVLDDAPPAPSHPRRLV